MKTLALSRKLTVSAAVLALVATGAGVAAFGAGCHLGGETGTTSETVERGGAQATSHPSAAARGRGRAEAPGLLHVYALTMSQELGFVAKQADRARPDSETVKLGLGAELRLAFVGADGERHRLFGQLANVKVSMNGADTATLAAELEKPFYVSTDADGLVRGYAFARGISPLAANMLRAVLGQTQIASRPGASYETQEDDIHGSYGASYTRAAGGRLDKKKGQYTRIATAGGSESPDKSARVETHGESSATLDESGWVVTLTSKETKVASLGDQMPTASTRIEVEMKETARRVDGSLAGRFEREAGELVHAGPFGIADDAASARLADERLVGQRSLDDLVAAARGTEGVSPRALLGEQLAARFRLTPSDTENAAGLVGKLPAKDAQLVTSALASAKTPEAVRAMGAIANQKELAVDVRAQAATALAFAGPLAGEAKDALLQAMGDSSRDVRTSATLALGNVARELGGDPALVSELVHGMREARDEDERISFLHALGNSGSLEVLPIAKEAMTSESEPLREAAMQALRFLPLGEADVMLDAAATTDGSETVRQASVDAMGFRIVERHAPALHRVLDADVSRKVKVEVFRVVSRALAGRGKTLAPEGRAILEASLAKAPPPSSD